jgi:hypothetical protein
MENVRDKPSLMRHGDSPYYHESTTLSLLQMHLSIPCGALLTLSSSTPPTKN